jgi:hypothetical protein
MTLLVVMTGCAMAGFGGALQLNITGQETRALSVLIDAGASDAHVVEIEAAEQEVDLGAGSATIERYILHRARLGSSTATGYFLCAEPCTDPLGAYLVAYSPEQVFEPDGELELRFRIVAADGTSRDLRRTIRAEMLPALWDNPRIEARISSR